VVSVRGNVVCVRGYCNVVNESLALMECLPMVLLLRGVSGGVG